MTMSKSDFKNLKKKMSKHLNKLGTGEVEPRHLGAGICNELGHFTFENAPGCCSVFVVQDLSRSWSEFSGEEDFPITDPEYPDNPFKSYIYKANLWVGEYGASRKRLCLFLAEELKSVSVKEFKNMFEGDLI